VALAAGLDLKAFALGGRTPAAAYAPETPTELAALLAACDRRGEAAVLFGGGTLQGFGFAPSRYDVAISTGALNRVLEHEAADLTIAVEAGMPVAELDATLAAHAQFVPLDAPLALRGSVGGLLASGWYGPRRATYGRPRDLLIGSSVVLADGTLAKAGGMVVKNVTGYDLSKLWCGSLGTLAAIVRANFKTLPVPAARRVALAPVPEHSLRRALEHLASLDIEPAAALALNGFAEAPGDDGADGRLFVLFEGAPVVVDRATRDLRSALGSAGLPQTSLLDGEAAAAAFRRLLDSYASRVGKRSATYRSFGLPSGALDRSETFAHLAARHQLRHEVLLDARSGDVYARVSAATIPLFAERIFSFDAAVATALSHTQIANAPESLRDRLAMWGPPTASLEAMRALKLRFDPNGTLGPGRFVGRM
jgi:glycolate oxidase FAD binding subunit